MVKSVALVLTIAFAATLVAVSSSLPSGATGTQRQVLERLQNDTNWETIGQIGNKVFLAHTPLKNWMASRDVCRQAELEFATFKDYTEFGFVYENTKNSSWISGIIRGAETYQPSAFNWDTNGEPVPLGINYHMFADHWICLYYSGDQHIYTDLCLKGSHQTLCQLTL